MYQYNKEPFKSLSIAFSKMLGSSTHTLSEEILIFIHYLGAIITTWLNEDTENT